MEPVVNEAAADKPIDELTAKDVLDRYKMEIQLYEKDFKPWETRSTKIVKRYRDERVASQTHPTRFNILYSNVQTLFPAAYGGDPKPDIQRRFKDDDPLGRVTADVLERCTSFSINQLFSDSLRHALLDRLLPGRGVTWVRYEPHFRPVDQITDTISEEAVEEVYYEEVKHDYVYWKDFGHNVSRIWPEVYLVWRKAYLSKDELEERFGKEVADLCPMDYSPKGLSDEKKNEVVKKSSIYECWDKNKSKVYWLHKDVERLLDAKPDPLKLPEFFPCPKPMMSTTTNDSLIPVPDYSEYQDQAMELDELTSRISSITKSLKVVGVYDSSASGISRMLDEGVENRLIPVESWAVFGEKGGLKAAVEFMPIKELAETLMVLYEAREKVKNDLYEITGIADIIRGATKASETATAQNIKSQFATLRLDSVQHSVARFAKEMVVNTALIIANHFSLETIKQISGVHLLTAQEKQQIQQQQMLMQQQAAQAEAMGQPAPPIPPISDEQQELLDNPTWEEVYELLRDQPHLTFRVDIETDSTIKMDEDAEKQARMEFLTAAGTFIQQSAEVAMQAPEMMPLLIQMLLFGVRGFKVGKNIEGQFRLLASKAEKAAKQPQPQKPDPEMEKLKADTQLQQQKMQNDKEASMAKLQIDQQSQAASLQADREKTAMQIQADREKTIMQIQSDEKKAQLDASTQMAKQEKDAQSQQKVATISTTGKTPEELQADEEAEKMQTEIILGAIKDQQKAQTEGTMMLAELIGNLLKVHSSPKEITLDNGRKATINPRMQ